MQLRPYIDNPRRGGWLGTIARAVLIIPIWMALLAVPAWSVITWADLCDSVPTAPDILAHDQRRDGTEILSSGRIRIGGSQQGQRPWTSIDKIPTLVISAFVAAEDEAFFDHHGVDPVSISRAAWVNAKQNKVTQGGSTITQQLAKMYVGREKSYDRKLNEAMLARRIEQSFDKLQILEAYLNRIYLGAGAHGVAAASERYFGKPLHALEVHEVALIAGLTAAPSRFNPYHNPTGALARRHYVLERMREVGFIDDDAFDIADQKPLELFGGHPDDVSAPYVVDQVKRELRVLDAEFFGDRKPVMERVLETSANLALQRRAVDAVRSGAEDLSQRRHDRVVLLHLAQSEWADFREDARQTWGPDLEHGQVVLGRVATVQADAASVEVGDTTVLLPPSSLHWARYKPEPEDKKSKRAKKKKPQTPRPATDFMQVGDLVRIRISDASNPAQPTAELLPVNDIQGALVALENKTGSVRALTGGTGWDVTQYNRATRGCRQPGSAFKPLLYSKALERGWTAATVIQDLPVRYQDSAGNLIWEPRNADRDFKGSLLLVSALARSRNLPAVKLVHELGISTVAAHARRLGITTPLKETASLALGASCVKPIDLTSVYATFARRGFETAPHLIRTVYTKDGELLADNGHFGEPTGPIDARIYRLLETARKPDKRVLTKEVAYLTNYMLRQVVLRGTATNARALDVPVAGKTGTTNNYDVWFAGFSDDISVSVWLGDDKNRKELGERESGGTSALPVWLDFMTLATAHALPRDLLDDPPDPIEFVRIDPESGQRAHPRAYGVWVPFVRGTAPVGEAPGPTEKAAAHADMLDREF